MMKFFLFALLALYMMLDETNVASAECCRGSAQNKCDDCQQTTPCCGKGSCNIFCCYCSGGCRTGPCRVSAGSQQDESDVHHLIREVLDRNGDKLVDLGETEKYFIEFRGNNDTTLFEKEFRTMDVSGDGFLSAEEIDPSIVVATTSC